MEGDDEDILATYARLTATPTKAQFTKQTGAEGLQVADTHSTKQNSKAVGGELQGGVMGSLTTKTRCLSKKLALSRTLQQTMRCEVSIAHSPLPTYTQ
jgi:hypothetical protein